MSAVTTFPISILKALKFAAGGWQFKMSTDVIGEIVAENQSLKCLC
jgi:hypothetical protein